MFLNLLKLKKLTVIPNKKIIFIKSDSILQVIEKYHDISLEGILIQPQVICFSEGSFFVQHFINLIEIDIIISILIAKIEN